MVSSYRRLCRVTALLRSQQVRRCGCYGWFGRLANIIPSRSLNNVRKRVPALSFFESRQFPNSGIHQKPFCATPPTAINNSMVFCGRAISTTNTPSEQHPPMSATSARRWYRGWPVIAVVLLDHEASVAFTFSTRHHGLKSHSRPDAGFCCRRKKATPSMAVWVGRSFRLKTEGLSFPWVCLNGRRLRDMDSTTW